MEEGGLQGLLLCQPENVFYLSNFRAVSTFSFKERPSIGVFMREQTEESFVVIPSWDVEDFSEKSWIKKIIGYSEHETDRPTPFLKGWGKALQGELRRYPHIQTIGIEEHYMPKWIIDFLYENFPEKRFVNSSEVIKRIRSVKTEKEIGLLRKATDITVNACHEMLSAVTRNVREEELARIYRKSVVEQGGENIHNFVIGFGKGSAVSHNIPSARPLDRDACIRFDLGATYEGYYGDTARSKIFGVPSRAQIRIYEAILGAQQNAASCIRPGAAAREMYEAAMGAARQILPNFVMEHVGHGLGVEMHESPALIWKNSEKLEVGMVLNVETIYRDSDLGGFAVEDTFLVTERGFECWTPMDRKLTF